MGKKYLASVANVELFAKENGKLVHWASAKTLTDSAFGFTLSMEEVRAGQGEHLRRKRTQVARWDAEPSLVRDQNSRKDVRVDVLVAAGVVGERAFEESVDAFAHRLADPADAAHHGDAVRALQVGGLSAAQFLAEDVADLADEFALLHFVEDVLAGLELSDGDQEPVAEVVEVPDIGQGHVARRSGHAVAHLERRTVREGRAEHLVRRHLRAEGADDALGQHFGLARSGRCQHKVASRGKVHNGGLF